MQESGFSDLHRFSGFNHILVLWTASFFPPGQCRRGNIYPKRI